MEGGRRRRNGSIWFHLVPVSKNKPSLVHAGVRWRFRARFVRSFSRVRACFLHLVTQLLLVGFVWFFFPPRGLMPRKSNYRINPPAVSRSLSSRLSSLRFSFSLLSEHSCQSPVDLSVNAVIHRLRAHLPLFHVIPWDFLLQTRYSLFQSEEFFRDFKPCKRFISFLIAKRFLKHVGCCHDCANTVANLWFAHIQTRYPEFFERIHTDQPSVENVALNASDHASSFDTEVASTSDSLDYHVEHVNSVALTESTNSNGPHIHREFSRSESMEDFSVLAEDSTSAENSGSLSRTWSQISHSSDSSSGSPGLSPVLEPIFEDGNRNGDSPFMKDYAVKRVLRDLESDEFTGSEIIPFGLSAEEKFQYVEDNMLEILFLSRKRDTAAQDRERKELVSKVADLFMQAYVTQEPKYGLHVQKIMDVKDHCHDFFMQAAPLVGRSVFCTMSDSEKKKAVFDLDRRIVLLRTERLVKPLKDLRDFFSDRNFFVAMPVREILRRSLERIEDDSDISSWVWPVASQFCSSPHTFYGGDLPSLKIVKRMLQMVLFRKNTNRFHWMNHFETLFDQQASDLMLDDFIISVVVDKLKVPRSQDISQFLDESVFWLPQFDAKNMFSMDEDWNVKVIRILSRKDDIE